MATLARPYAVIRRAVADSGANIEGDAADEESDAEREAEQEAATSSPVAPKKARLHSSAAGEDGEGEEDDPPLFPEMATPSRPARDLPPSSLPPSSPPAPSSQGPEYSSDLSSPVRGMDAWGFARRPGSDDEDDEAQQEREAERRERERKRRRAARPPRERARHYEVVAVVRKKIVFSLR